jgi:Sin3 family co-repressor
MYACELTCLNTAYTITATLLLHKQDYPRPACSERSFVEADLLNDTWVSVPVGSEDSYRYAG